MPCVLYVPRAYDPAKAWPLVVFLHGSGESGADGQKVIAQGIGRDIAWHAERWPCLVLMPQKPDQRQWETFDSEVVAAIVGARLAYNVDPDRISLTGLSQGGHGTWSLATTYPGLWCALAPVCGYPEPLTSDAIAAGVGGSPVWCFHGGRDDVVVPARSEGVIEALRKAGNTVKFTLYPDANHNSWDRAYAEAELPAFLLRAK